MKGMKHLIYRIWIQRDFSEAEEAFFDVMVWDEFEQQPVKALQSPRLKTVDQALETVQQVIEDHPHILFKPNPSGRVIVDR